MSILKPEPTMMLNFYRSGPMPCPYIEGLIERKLFARLTGPEANRLNSKLSRAGFRRSHDIIYKPACDTCQACVPVRINVEKFQYSKSQRRARNRNASLIWEPYHAVATEEDFKLFSAYQQGRHTDSDMASMTYFEYRAMIEDGKVDTLFFKAFSQDVEQGTKDLTAIMLADRLEDGYSAVYSFFKPEMTKRSLGVWLVLKLIEQARAENLPYIYLGYWIAQSQKMAYKENYSGLEAFGPEGWQPHPSM